MTYWQPYCTASAKFRQQIPDFDQGQVADQAMIPAGGTLKSLTRHLKM
jgi:hypothetical protein